MTAVTSSSIDAECFDTCTITTTFAIPNLRLYKHNPADAGTTASKFYDFQIELYGEEASVLRTCYKSFKLYF